MGLVFDGGQVLQRHKEILEAEREKMRLEREREKQHRESVYQQIVDKKESKKVERDRVAQEQEEFRQAEELRQQRMHDLMQEKIQVSPHSFYCYPFLYSCSKLLEQYQIIMLPPFLQK